MNVFFTGEEEKKKARERNLVLICKNAAEYLIYPFLAINHHSNLTILLSSSNSNYLEATSHQANACTPIDRG